MKVPQHHADPRYRSVGNDSELRIDQFSGPSEKSRSFRHDEGDSVLVAGQNYKKIKHIATTDMRHKIIHGPDDREEAPVRDLPYKCICLLYIRDYQNLIHYATGFFISERCVITAGHCVFYKRNWMKDIEVVPAASGANKPFGSAVSKRFRSVEGWTKAGNSNFDYGAIILNDDVLYNKVQSKLTYRPIQEEKSIELSGYPLDKHKTQWRSHSRFSKLSKYRIYYYLDTVQGNSGSPIYINNGGESIVTGVHSFGGDPNYSIRLNQPIMNRWSEWSKL